MPETTLANGAVAAAGQDFRPDDDLTRGEMASMLVRGLGYTSSLAETASSYGVPFSDVTVNRGFITVAYDLGIMGGTGTNRFEPDAFATREQAAAMLEAGEISKEDYDKWRYHYPEFDKSQNYVKVPPQDRF